MKTKYLLLLSTFILIVSEIIGQTDWRWNNPQPQGNYLYSISKLDTNTYITCGNFGSCLKSTDGGETWSIIKQNNYYNFRSVSFVNNKTGWMVCLEGKILKSIDGGETWIEQTSGISSQLFSVSGIDEQICYAAGASGIILKTTNEGESWESLITPTESILFSIKFVDENKGVAAGSNGTVITTTNGGVSWNISYVESSDLFFSVEIIYNNIWVCGKFGRIIHSANFGNTWEIQQNNSPLTLNCVAFADNLTGYICGFQGQLLKTIDGGATWKNGDRLDVAINFLH